jgi:putative aldouronate transport system permease protein
MMIRPSHGERLFHAFNYCLLSVFSLLCLLPFLYVISISLTSLEESVQRDIIWFPYQPTLAAYREMLGGKVVLNAYQVTLFVALVGTALNLLVTSLTAYPLARKNLPYRQIILLGIIFTIVFSGGMIPHYILVKSLGLLNSTWSLIVPGLVSAFYLLVMKSFMEQLPEEVFESARIDGAGEWLILARIVIPLSLPVFLSLGLFYGVGHWNSFFDALLYINDSHKYPLQVVLRSILLGNTNVETVAENSRPINQLGIQMAAVVITITPILLVYPFLQKHFVKGITLGSVK